MSLDDEILTYLRGTGARSYVEVAEQVDPVWLRSAVRQSLARLVREGLVAKEDGDFVAVTRGLPEDRYYARGAWVVDSVDGSSVCFVADHEQAVWSAQRYNDNEEAAENGTW